MDAASDKQAVNIVLLDVRDLCGFADYFVICSGESQRQLHAIFDGVEKSLKDDGVKPYRQEGSSDSGWMLEARNQLKFLKYVILTAHHRESIYL